MMKAHTPEQFAAFLSQLQETNQTLGFFCDYHKIAQNVDDVKLSLCMLNSLIGSTDLAKSVRTIWNRDKEAFGVLPILIAVRDDGRKKIIDRLGKCVTMASMFEDEGGVLTFLEDSGLADLFANKQIKDLVDYVFGIETGLDSNARKNRSGHTMENTIANILSANKVTFRQEVYSSEWQLISKALGTDKKRFDFVIETPGTTFLIEVNFYSGGGSKLNEVARAYSELAPKINSISGFEFVWITDGIGWLSARNKLQEAYYTISNVFNLSDLHLFISRVKDDTKALLRVG